MKIYLDEYGNVIEDPALALAGNVYVYGTKRGDFVFPIDGKILTLTAEDPEPEDK
ncbi:MAG: hypothetical protein IJT43_00610 [Stomatobaculum sp.]|nr:hypothetical protein [Stomatobaculum sp.]